MRQPSAAADDADRPEPPCLTHRLLSPPPPDLLSWCEAAAALAHTPHPMSERSLRRGYKADPGRTTWRTVGRRGELVSMSEVFAFHRDWVRARSQAEHAMTA